jgi:hypothetical protein
VCLLRAGDAICSHGVKHIHVLTYSACACWRHAMALLLLLALYNVLVFAGSFETTAKFATLPDLVSYSGTGSWALAINCIAICLSCAHACLKALSGSVATPTPKTLPRHAAMQTLRHGSDSASDETRSDGSTAVSAAEPLHAGKSIRFDLTPHASGVPRQQAHVQQNAVAKAPQQESPVLLQPQQKRPQVKRPRVWHATFAEAETGELAEEGGEEDPELLAAEALVASAPDARRQLNLQPPLPVVEGVERSALSDGDSDTVRLFSHGRLDASAAGKRPRNIQPEQRAGAVAQHDAAKLVKAQSRLGRMRTVRSRSARPIAEGARSKAPTRIQSTLDVPAGFRNTILAPQASIARTQPVIVLSPNWLLRATLVAAVSSVIVLIMYIAANARMVRLTRQYLPAPGEPLAVASAARAYHDLHAPARMLLPARATDSLAADTGMQYSAWAGWNMSTSVPGVCALLGGAAPSDSSSGAQGQTVVADSGSLPLWAQPADLTEFERFAHMLVRCSTTKESPLSCQKFRVG